MPSEVLSSPSAVCGNEKAVDFTRASHRIVQSTLLLSFFCSTEGIQARTISMNAAGQQGELLLALCFDIAIAEVLDHSLWFVKYAEQCVARLNGCVNSTSQAYVRTYALTTD